MLLLLTLYHKHWVYCSWRPLMIIFQSMSEWQALKCTSHKHLRSNNLIWAGDTPFEAWLYLKITADWRCQRCFNTTEALIRSLQQAVNLTSPIWLVLEMQKRNTVSGQTPCKCGLRSDVVYIVRGEEGFLRLVCVYRHFFFKFPVCCLLWLLSNTEKKAFVV